MALGTFLVLLLLVPNRGWNFDTGTFQTTSTRQIMKITPGRYITKAHTRTACWSIQRVRPTRAITICVHEYVNCTIMSDRTDNYYPRSYLIHIFRFFLIGICFFRLNTFELSLTSIRWASRTSRKYYYICILNWTKCVFLRTQTTQFCNYYIHKNSTPQQLTKHAANSTDRVLTQTIPRTITHKGPCKLHSLCRLRRSCRPRSP